MIVFQCFNCSKKLKVSSEQAGNARECPGCGAYLSIPMKSMDEEALLAATDQPNHNKPKASRPGNAAANTDSGVSKELPWGKKGSAGRKGRKKSNRLRGSDIVIINLYIFTAVMVGLSIWMTCFSMFLFFMSIPMFIMGFSRTMNAIERFDPEEHARCLEVPLYFWVVVAARFPICWKPLMHSVAGLAVVIFAFTNLTLRGFVLDFSSKP